MSATARSATSTQRGVGAAAIPNITGSTISATEFERLRRETQVISVARTLSIAEEAEQQLRASRREASQARSGKWPNTLVAARARKTQARLDERDAREHAAQELDAIEEDVLRQERLGHIRRANEYYSQQSDRMKALENYRQRSHDVEVDKAQAELRAHRKVGEVAREASYAATIMADVAAASGEEGVRRDAARAKAAAIVADQKAQLSAIISRRLAELDAREAEGRAMLARIAKMNEDATLAAEAKQVSAAAENKRFQAENIRLKEARNALKSQEGEMMVWIEGQARSKQAKEAAIKAIIDSQRAEAAKKAEVIRDIMARDYMARASNEEHRVAKDAAEAQVREQNEAAEKARKGVEMREAILHHIELMRRKTVESIMQQQEEDAREHHVFTDKIRALEEQEAADIASRRVVAKAYQTIQRAQAADKKRNVEGSMSNDRRDAVQANGMAAGGPLDAAFYNEVAKVREEEERKGHDTRPLERAVYKLLNPPLLANLSR